MGNLCGLLNARKGSKSSPLRHLTPPSCVRLPPTPLHLTYMHLRIELLGRRRGGVGPRHVVVGGHVAITVGRVPRVVAGGPGQGGPQWWQQVVQGPGHDGVVVEGDVEGYDADGEAYPWVSWNKFMWQQLNTDHIIRRHQWGFFSPSFQANSSSYWASTWHFQTTTIYMLSNFWASGIWRENVTISITETQNTSLDEQESRDALQGRGWEG